ncbi:hypothetical protein [Streptomyces sp. URMC 129]|uniref:hypothetical protein n=1 Tax=Streptomyces sp. URMC 129 TaxID=3423407 RepID=UPI003F1C130D
MLVFVLVSTGVAGATSEAEFFTRLTEQGILIRRRHAPFGDLLGYTVALPGDRNRDGHPLWFSGAKLAPDLSWPRGCQRLGTQLDTTTSAAPDAQGTGGPGAAVIARQTAAEWSPRGRDDPSTMRRAVARSCGEFAMGAIPPETTSISMSRLRSRRRTRGHSRSVSAALAPDKDHSLGDAALGDRGLSACSGPVSASLES